MLQAAKKKKKKKKKKELQIKARARAGGGGRSMFRVKNTQLGVPIMPQW